MKRPAMSSHERVLAAHKMTKANGELAWSSPIQIEWQ